MLYGEMRDSGRNSIKGNIGKSGIVHYIYKMVGKIRNKDSIIEGVDGPQI